MRPCPPGWRYAVASVVLSCCHGLGASGSAPAPRTCARPEPSLTSGELRTCVRPRPLSRLRPPPCPRDVAATTSVATTTSGRSRVIVGAASRGRPCAARAPARPRPSPGPSGSRSARGWSVRSHRARCMGESGRRAGEMVGEEKTQGAAPSLARPARQRRRRVGDEAVAPRRRRVWRPRRTSTRRWSRAVARRWLRRRRARARGCQRRRRRQRRSSHRRRSATRC